MSKEHDTRCSCRERHAADDDNDNHESNGGIYLNVNSDDMGILTRYVYYIKMLIIIMILFALFSLIKTIDGWYERFYDTLDRSSSVSTSQLHLCCLYLILSCDDDHDQHLKLVVCLCAVSFYNDAFHLSPSSLVDHFNRVTVTAEQSE